MENPQLWPSIFLNHMLISKFSYNYCLIKTNYLAWNLIQNSENGRFLRWLFCFWHVDRLPFTIFTSCILRQVLYGHCILFPRPIHIFFSLILTLPPLFLSCTRDEYNSTIDKSCIALALSKGKGIKDFYKLRTLFDIRQ